MELPSAYTNSTLDEVLSDLSVRFIINLPQEELVSRERVCFQIEEAHWFYEDFIREQRPDLPNLNLNTFLGKIFAHNPMLSKWGMHQDAYREFMEYKHRVPVRGGILMNSKMDKVVLVKGWKAGASWAFPRGKINKDEADHVCAVREVLEETGFDSSELVDASAFLVDSSEENVDRHLQLYLIRNVPEDFNFHPLARKEISEVAWFSIVDLQAQSNAHRRRREQTKNSHKSGAEDSERGGGNKLRVYKVYGFLPGLTRWIKDQRRAMRQQARGKKHGAVYETEPESSAVEASPPRQKKNRDIDPKSSTPQPVPNNMASSAASIQLLPQTDDSSLSAASAKLREMIGIGLGPVPVTVPPVHPQFDKVNAGQSLLAQLQGSTPSTPSEPPQRPPNTGVSISVSALFNASKQESQQNPQTPAQPNFGPPVHTQSPHNNFNPSVRRPHQNGGPRNGHGRQGQYNTQQQPPKQPFTILQRGQPLPDRNFQTQPPMASASPISTRQPPFPPPTALPQQPQMLQRDVPPPSHMGNNEAIIPLNPPPQPTSDSQPDMSSPNKLARRPVLTIDAFTPPQPAQPPTQEHKGNLLDILRGARPPPPPQPAMQLQAEESTAEKPSTLSLNDILAGQGVKLPKQVASPSNQASPMETNPLANGTQMKQVKSDHLSNLMKTLQMPKKITPPGTLNTTQFPASQQPENQPIATNKPVQLVKPAQSLNSPISPMNGVANSPTTTSTPTLPRNVGGGVEGLKNVTSFDRRSTIKPEQAQTLLGLFKSPTVESPTIPTSLPVAPTQNNIPPRSVPAKEKTDKTAASEMHRTGSLSVAPEMQRTGSLSVEQTAFLMNFLDNLATSHGV
ncbi:hypothetical protein H072_1454 [Dactylellina haptotyla CBS 200.50]|uniref:Nudix hydrolase domain-containing protein n=1 Tax=Dactylellina haptotyla (strain CBS 200.50) TaxID=1284197 RepID=S8ANN0_DACHA|nr:hypothetical protein H072_1454 [Dactylellina haptotyla CBS 200.50]